MVNVKLICGKMIGSEIIKGKMIQVKIIEGKIIILTFLLSGRDFRIIQLGTEHTVGYQIYDQCYDTGD